MFYTPSSRGAFDQIWHLLKLPAVPYIHAFYNKVLEISHTDCADDDATDFPISVRSCNPVQSLCPNSTSPVFLSMATAITWLPIDTNVRVNGMRRQSADITQECAGERRTWPSLRGLNISYQRHISCIPVTRHIAEIWVRLLKLCSQCRSPRQASHYNPNYAKNCMYVCTYVCMHARMYVCMYVRISHW